MEIFVDGTNFRIAQLEAGIRDLDIPRFARQLARGHVLVKMRYYTSPLPDHGSAAYRGQQRFFETTSCHERRWARAGPERAPARERGVPRVRKDLGSKAPRSKRKPT
jgi:hypothetical protein